MSQAQEINLLQSKNENLKTQIKEMKILENKINQEKSMVLKRNEELKNNLVSHHDIIRNTWKLI